MLSTVTAGGAGLLLTGAAARLFGSGSAEAPTPPADGVPRRVRLAFFPNVTHAAALVGTASGEFQQALGSRTRLEERVFTAGPAEIEALFAGEVDLGYIGPGPALNGFIKSRGEALRIVAGAASGGVALVARPDVPIASLADLAGKRVAIPQIGGTQDISLRHALKETGLEILQKGGTVDVVHYAPSDIPTLFHRRELDAAWVAEPWVARLEEEQGSKIVLDERDHWPGRRFSTAVVIVRTGFLQQYPETVAAVLRAHIGVVERIRRNPDAVRPMIGARLKELNAGKALPSSVLQKALARTEITRAPLEESVLTFAAWGKELGYHREKLSSLATLFAGEPLRQALRIARKPEASPSDRSGEHLL